jgi:glycosyltransferase involved in cell wall biosynthesis
MKVLFLTQFFSTTRGGGENLFSIIAEDLTNNKHDVWVITNRIIGENYKDDKIKKIFVKPNLEHKGGLPPKFGENIKFVYNAIIEGRKLIKKYNVDIIHSNNFAPAFAGFILSLLTKTPHVTAIWDIFTLCGKSYWSEWAQQTGVSKIHEFIGPKFEKMIAKIPNTAIHTISEATKEDLIKFGTNNPVHVISPTIEMVKRFKVKFNPFQFVCIGRLVFYKNIEVIIRAFSKLKKIEPRAKLIIVGDGPHKESLLRLTKDLELKSNVEFRGYVTNEEKNKIISESNSLLFPSLCEGFGLVILEAFYQAKPVLVSNVRPMSEIIENEKTGFILDSFDELEWVKRIQELIKNPNLSIRMGENAFALFKMQFSHQKMYEKILEMYENITQK